ncbi:MAG: histidine-type phosphatase [Prevotella sp.]|nr:histidine-type phosphatase [Prevotella sp.]
MRRATTLLWALLLATAMATHAQTPRQELRADATRSASNFAAYPGPGSEALTPAPKGMKPVYLSHYGRHGSRYMSKTKEYDYLFDVLDKASRLDKLSPLGHDVLGRVERIRREADNRTGELTPLGIEQHRQIARRMAGRFPQIMGARNGVVTAQSTLAVRCILSMHTALMELQRLNPRLSVSADAGMRQQHYMNFTDRQLIKNITTIESRQCFSDLCLKHACWQRVVDQLFCDSAYVAEAVDGERLNYYLFRMASNVQNMELRDSLTLYDLFTPDELYHNWVMNNAFWFLGYGRTPLTGSLQPYTQRHLLRQIVSDADSCLQLPHPTASLRFGHDTVLLPLVCLLGVDGYGQSIGSLDSLEERGWADYRVFPMACNLQLVFYRHARAQGADGVLVKVLLNEREASLPLTPVTGPYYRWSDVRRYCLEVLSRFDE